MRAKPIFREDIQGVVVAVVLDTRRAYNSGKDKEPEYPLAVRVTSERKVWYYKTGIRLTIDDFEAVEKATSKGKYYNIKNDRIKPVFKNVCSVVEELKNSNQFSFTNLESKLGNKPVVSDKSLMVHWQTIGESKQKVKTREQYKSAYRSFFIANGASQRTGSDNKTKVLYGRVLDMMPEDISETNINRWLRYMQEQDNSPSTKSMYIRAFRAVMNSLKEQGIIKEVPKIAIPKSTRRTDNFLSVSDILKLRDYQGEGKTFADWWIIIYLCNGANMRDIAALEWGEEHSSELTFTRSKTAEKSPSVVHIPITPLLAPYLEKYASKRVKGKRVFPEILGSAKSETSIANKVHDFLADIRKGLQSVCKECGLPAVSAAWARNSYITALTWHGISDKFIDDMVGHTDGSVLAGYQGKISPKKRMQINSLLFTNPEEDE